MRKICGEVGSKNVSVKKKANRLEICQDLLGRLEIEPHFFLDKVITRDESWVFDYDPETKRQSAEWHTKSSPRPKKARMSRYRVKTMITVFFDSRGITPCLFRSEHDISEYVSNSRSHKQETTFTS